jgi:hypothetical protein
MVDVGPSLTHEGEALGLDVGAVLAHELERAVDGLRWGIDRSRKDYVSYNRPLLIGPAPPPFDPRLVGPVTVKHLIGPDGPRNSRRLMPRDADVELRPRATAPRP